MARDEQDLLDLVSRVWEITRLKPADSQKRIRWVTRYWYSLLQATVTHPNGRYVREWKKKKKSGQGTRTLVEARPYMSLVHVVLGYWLQSLIPETIDYAYTSRDALDAARVHYNSEGMVVIDIKNAFDNLPAELIKRHIRFWAPYLEEDELDLIVNLLTKPSEGEVRAMQGMASTSHLFNLVAYQMDQALSALAERIGILQVTRYSDNIAVSVSNVRVLPEVEQALKDILEEYGFEMSWVVTFGRHPFEYLGVKISQGHLGLTDEKYKEYVTYLQGLLERNNPLELEYVRKSVTGKLAYAIRVYEHRLPTQLTELFVKYYAVIKKDPPMSLRKILAQRNNRS